MAFRAGNRSVVTAFLAFRQSMSRNPTAALSDMFVATLGQEDTRRPRVDIGLGIWTNTSRRYYPMERIRERGNAFIDRIDGRSVLVYLDPENFAPAALFVDASDAKLLEVTIVPLR